MAKTIAVVLLDGFADWEAGLLAAGATAWLGADVSYVTPDGQAVASMGGLHVTPDAGLDGLEVARCDALVLVGSSRWEGHDAPDLGPLLRAAHEAGLAIGAICGGTLAAARAGLLDARPHTSNALAYLQDHAPGYGGAARYVDGARAVRSGRLVTAPASAPSTFAAEMLGLLWPGHEVVAQLSAMTAQEHRSS